MIESKISVISWHAFQHENPTVHAFRSAGPAAARTVPGGRR
ncbi:hypothetical protein [Plasticicumulans lactativorans]|nr:hypothetical protein [Plasticicumulans lactativorans]